MIKQLYVIIKLIYPKERSPSDCSFTRGNRDVPSSILRPQYKGSHFDCSLIVVLLKNEDPFVVWETVWDNSLRSVWDLFLTASILQQILRPRTESS